MTGVALGTCGRDVNDLSDLLALSELLSSPNVAPGTDVSRSAGAVRLDAEGCADPIAGGDKLASDCDASTFPWTVMTGDLENSSLFGLGVRTVKRAAFETNGSPFLEQMVLEPGPETSGVAALYVEHATQCGAQVIASSNGAPTLLQLDGKTPLSMSIDGGTVNVLIGLNGKSTLDLMASRGQPSTAETP